MMRGVRLHMPRHPRIPTRAHRKQRFRLQRLEGQRIRQIAVRDGIGGVRFERFAVALDRLIQPTHVLEHSAEIGMQSAILRIDPEALAQHFLRFIMLPQEAEKPSQVVERRQKIRSSADGRFARRDG